MCAGACASAGKATPPPPHRTLRLWQGEDGKCLQRFDGTQSTVYEIKILAAEAGLDRVTQGATFGFALCSNDGDEAVLGESEQSGQKGWSGWGPYAIVFGKNSASAGLVTLVPFKVSVTGPRIKRGKG